MSVQNEKCVLILEENLPIGIAANTAAILGITIGSKKPNIVGQTVQDKNENSHLGIIQFPVPILKAGKQKLAEIRKILFSQEYCDLTVIDFSELAQSCKTYDEYVERMADSAGSELVYIGIAVCGNKKKINKLTGNLSLLR